jgi:hypothetical protein
MSHGQPRAHARRLRRGGCAALGCCRVLRAPCVGLAAPFTCSLPPAAALAVAPRLRALLQVWAFVFCAPHPPFCLRPPHPKLPPPQPHRTLTAVGTGMGVATWYLALYNAAQAASWTYVLGASCHALLRSPTAPCDAVYGAASGVVSLCQTASLLETAHALLGLTRSGVSGNVQQWAGVRALPPAPSQRAVFSCAHSLPMQVARTAGGSSLRCRSSEQAPRWSC